MYTIGMYLEKGGVAVMIGAGVKDRVGRYFRQYYRCGSVIFPTLDILYKTSIYNNHEVVKQVVLVNTYQARR